MTSPFTSLEPEDRRELLRATGAKHGLKVFIETGTNQGLTPLALLHSFERIYTIELDERLHRAALRMFKDQPHVTCMKGNSGQLLTRVMAGIDEPALVWLDGHYSGPGTAFTEESTPIRDELAVLLEDPRPHVIFVDDARIFGGGPEHDLYPHYAPYPDLTWVEETVGEHGYTYELADDIMRLYPA
jgi:hypothetical protein